MACWLPGAATMGSAAARMVGPTVYRSDIVSENLVIFTKRSSSDRTAVYRPLHGLRPPMRPWPPTCRAMSPAPAAEQDHAPAVGHKPDRIVTAGPTGGC